MLYHTSGLALDETLISCQWVLLGQNDTRRRMLMAGGVLPNHLA